MPPAADLQLQQEAVMRLRTRGESLRSLALIEDDLMTGLFRWANPFFLEKTGYELHQLQTLTVFDLMPSHFQVELRERLAGKRAVYFIAPIITADRRVSWWLAEDVLEHYPVHWAEGRYLRTTAAEGPDFENMITVAEITNAAGAVFRDHEQVHEQLRSEVVRLEETDETVRREVQQLRQEVFRASAAARDAANAALRIDQSVKELQSMHSNLETRVSTEILRLIGTDHLYEKQFSDFQAQLKTAAERARNSIQAAADDAGKTISFKMSFPVGVVGGMAVIVNHLLEHPEIIAKVLGLFGIVH